MIVYAHNLSSFDGLFLLRHLHYYGKVKPLYFKGKLMSIELRILGGEHNGKTIVFKDSYLLLPASLIKLCGAFKVEAYKTQFPFKLHNLNYNGVFPIFEYWKGITIESWLLAKEAHGNGIWNFKNEAIKYCQLDCKSLHQVLTSFNKLIFDNFQINIHSVLTVPSLAMKIYKTHFMPKGSLYQIAGQIEKAIRLSYTGGAVDVFKPHNKIGLFNNSNKYNKLYYYDVNSLYPFVMKNAPMPIGKPIYFDGNIRLVEKDAYGFFYCKIISPLDINHPILQRRIVTSEGIRTIAGLGSWEGWIYSAEMDNAIKHGYTFEILNGYQFNKGNIFSDYINTLYKLRLEYPKPDPMNLIAKLLMNSLYGKFGMKLTSTKLEMFNTKDEIDNNILSELIDKLGNTIKDLVKLDDHVITIRDSYIYNDENSFHGIDVNIALASAITAGARMWMSAFKNNPLFNIYYSDTDSIVVDSQLPEFIVGKDLGQFKLEHTISKAVFLAPKVYGFITDEGKEIIKIKGLTNNALVKINFNDLESLLVKDSLMKIDQEKWTKKIIMGDISVNE